MKCFTLLYFTQVCKVCCLTPDFKQFPYGDLSLVGDRGVSLSGGQRARINLARAIYREVCKYFNIFEKILTVIALFVIVSNLKIISGRCVLAG